MNKMNDGNPDGLDRLLDSLPLRKAPAWFEARTMARLRNEPEPISLRDRVLDLLLDRARSALGFAVAAVLCVAAGVYFSHPSGSDDSVAQNKMFEGFAAMKSYVAEQESWRGDSY